MLKAVRAAFADPVPRFRRTPHANDLGFRPSSSCGVSYNKLQHGDRKGLFSMQMTATRLNCGIGSSDRYLMPKGFFDLIPLIR